MNLKQFQCRSMTEAHLCARIQNSASSGVSIGFRNEKGLEERPKAIIRKIFRFRGLWKGKED